ncbi:subclass B3 metallo-beta-lactamase [Sphingomonas sp.]|uniref:subclass B3 metallo-beta-lactamase n=1 Tax=Sphingomonas sp. TaxID=28214 RepID=UPI001B20E318|nr:subclass B3 metallo-beta-lactamase [Sphingomonas sp.]MBO9712817.1 subclass B3 metallo-beta-lactamase [Sphingomonas sp.]
MRALALAALLLTGAAAPSAQTTDWAQAVAEWTKPMAPFHIAGNVYYVGTAGISAYLVTGPKGHILIDGALPQSADVIAAHITQLGFKLSDVKILLINHAHFDHAGGLAKLKALTGAQLLASASDTSDLEAGFTSGRPELLKFPPVKVDRVIGEGEHIRLGTTDLVTRLTPGHTRGCTSWTTRVTEGGRKLAVLFACSLTVAGEKLVGKQSYPGVDRDFPATFAKLRTLKADIFLNFHPAAFDMETKRAKLLAGDRFAFVDARELRRRVDEAEDNFKRELAAQMPKP